MENRSHALWAGFFTIVLLCATVIAGIWLNRDKSNLTSYEIVTTSAVSGLNPQAAVRYRGLAVGRVTRLDFDPVVPGQIVIRIGINPATPITQSTYATLSSQGVTGIAFVQLDDDGKRPVKITATEGQIIRIPLRPGMLETLERSSNSILSKSTVIAERLSALLTPENQQIMLGAFAKTGQATAQWELLAKQLSPAIQQLPALTAQTGATLTSIQQLAEDARKMSQQLTLLTQQLQSPAAPFNRALSGVEHISDQMELETLPQINALTNDASNSVRAFNHTLNDLQEQPQSLLFGKPAPAPGPGESGFVAPTK